MSKGIVAFAAGTGALAGGLLGVFTGAGLAERSLKKTGRRDDLAVLGGAILLGGIGSVLGAAIAGAIAAPSAPAATSTEITR